MLRPPEAAVYLLSSEDFGVILSLQQILLNFEIYHIDLDLTTDAIEMRAWQQVPAQVLAAVAPAFRESKVPTPEEWKDITEGKTVTLLSYLSMQSLQYRTLCRPSSL